ncbi:hypothetical protein [Bacillus alkalicellulosilyticus]|uniref:hypothetical protein n=1 Tax=Alkalihalobacterium alkalicellulosilyticum TaxID=1912214 RepID=UPI0009980851|nr:hypothetical protein [Bacillus alkalicellulosilyticus]
MKSTHDNLSIHVSKEQLNMVIKDVLGEYRIFWGFNKGRMILNIYNSEVNNKLMFKRHKGYLELIRVEVTCEEVVGTLDKSFNFTEEMKREKIEETRNREKTLYEKIDDYLLALHDAQQFGDKESITEIKRQLTKLTQDIKMIESLAKS